MALSSHNRAPLYHQIYLILRSKIFDGTYPPNSYLPGERELGEMFNVSRITTVRALNELAASKLVVRERGRGTRVQFVASGTVARGPAEASPDPKVATGTVEESLDAIRRLKSAQATVFDFDYVTPAPAVSQALTLPPGDKTQYVTRVWRLEGKPFNYITTYVPEALGRKWTRTELEKTPLGDLMEREGVIVSLVQERVTATLADVLLAERLEVSVGSPLIKITRTTFDAEGQGVEYLIGFYPPDRYQYEVTLPRVGQPEGPQRASGPAKRSRG